MVSSGQCLNPLERPAPVPDLIKGAPRQTTGRPDPSTIEVGLHSLAGHERQLLARIARRDDSRPVHTQSNCGEFVEQIAIEAVMTAPSHPFSW